MTFTFDRFFKQLKVKYDGLAPYNGGGGDADDYRMYNQSYDDDRAKACTWVVSTRDFEKGIMFNVYATHYELFVDLCCNLFREKKQCVINAIRVSESKNIGIVRVEPPDVTQCIVYIGNDSRKKIVTVQSVGRTGILYKVFLRCEEREIRKHKTYQGKVGLTFVATRDLRYPTEDIYVDCFATLYGILKPQIPAVFKNSFNLIQTL